MSTVPRESSLVSKKTVFVTDRDVSRGTSAPLGATVVRGGVNFSIFSRSASGVELLLFDSEDDPRPARVITITGMYLCRI
jgi:pullulanase/glycogen debranching enzyme